VRGVAAWDRRPDADAILAARLARGWKPTPSPLQGGDRVLGHACSVVRPG